MNISTILNQIDLGAMALPEFQRGYVWNRDQVRKLMDSLYRRYPVGSLLVWVTKTEGAPARGDGQLTPGSVELILDGQQRMTSLYGVIRGKPPKFFDGNAQAFTGLYFNLEDETFGFYAPLKMKDNPLWIDVTELMQQGPGAFMKRLVTTPEVQDKLTEYIDRVNQLHGIVNIDIHIEKVTGEDKTVDVVVDIFNVVNSGGTKLSKGDLALAKICAQWPDARDEMKTRLEKWARAGYDFKLDWYLRNINALLTGEALFTALKDVSTEEFKQALQLTEKGIDTFLNLIASRLGLDHDRVLGSRYSFPLLVRYWQQHGQSLSDAKERDQLLYWYVHTFLWGRYAGSTESVLNQDLEFIERPEGALERLIEGLRRNRGDLRISAEDFSGWSMGARFYPLLYMMTRVWHSRDWETGVELTGHLLGKLSTLQVHHIFPKAQLYAQGYNKAEVNALANFTFLTQDTNLKVSNRLPEEYLAAYASKHPGALESHWIPMDRELWKLENYLDFLAARRELLAQAANDFLDSLYHGAVPEQALAPTEHEVLHVIPGSVESEDEEQQLLDINSWVVEQGLPEGEFMLELTDEDSNALALLDLAWPEGLQQGLSQPVTLLLDEASEVEELANQAGYKFFTSVAEFKRYVEREVLALEEAAD